MGVPGMNNTPQRLRVLFSKDGNLRFIGHLDLQRLFERALRRSGLPLRYSQGFNPKVRLNLACALPLGFSSDCELMDFWLESQSDLESVNQKLTQALPKELRVLGVEEVPNNLPSLQSSTLSCEYEIRFPSQYSGEELETHLQSLLQQEHLVVARKKKSVDIRELLQDWGWEKRPEGTVLRLVLNATPEATGRPDEWITLMGIDFAECSIHRSRLILSSPTVQEGKND